MDILNSLSVFGGDHEMLPLRALLLMVYGSFLLWLILVEVYRLKIQRSLHRGFFEFHLLSLPLLILVCVFLKIQGISNGPQCQKILFPHFFLIGLSVMACSLEWKLKFRRIP